MNGEMMLICFNHVQATWTVTYKHYLAQIGDI